MYMHTHKLQCICSSLLYTVHVHVHQYYILYMHMKMESKVLHFVHAYEDGI